MPYVRRVHTHFDKNELSRQQEQEQQEQQRQLQQQQQEQEQQERRRQQQQQQQQQQHARSSYTGTDFDTGDLSGQVSGITKQLDLQRAWCKERYGNNWSATDRSARIAEARAALRGGP